MLFRLVFITLCLSLKKKNPFPVLVVINSFISFPICFTCSAMLYGLYSLLCYYLPQICFALLHELFLTAEQRQDVNPRKQSAESAIKQEQECLCNLLYPKRYSKKWESSVCGYHHTDKANSTGKSWTRLLCLLINHLETFILFLLWALNNKDEVSQNAAGPSAKMKRGYFRSLASSLAPLHSPDRRARS